MFYLMKKKSWCAQNSTQQSGKTKESRFRAWNLERTMSGEDDDSRTFGILFKMDNVARNI